MAEQTARPQVAQGDSVRLIEVPGVPWREGQIAEVVRVDDGGSIQVRCVDGAQLYVPRWERVNGEDDARVAPNPQPADPTAWAQEGWDKARQLEAEFENFKRQVVDLARDVARAQGWCEDGQRATLARLGLELPADPTPRRRRFTVTYTVEVEATPTSEPVANAAVVDRACVLGFDGRQVQLDGCWADAEIHNVSCTTHLLDPPTTAPGPF